MNKQPEPRRFYVRSPDGRPIFGFDEREGAAAAARAYGDGAFLVVTCSGGQVTIDLFPRIWVMWQESSP